MHRARHARRPRARRTLPRGVSASFDPDRLRRLGAAFAADVEAGTIPGAVVLVARHGAIAMHDAFGYRDRAAAAALGTDAIFRAASMTKPVTVVAALQLAEDGALDLYAPVATYLPAFERLRVGVETVAADGSRALSLAPPKRAPTIQDLMRHTAGFTYGERGDSLVHRMYREANVTATGQTNADLVRKLAELPLVYEPGGTFEYGMSIDVLGAVVEAVAGKPLGDVVRERITAPLGMRSTGFALAPAARERLADPHPDPTSGANPLDFLFAAGVPEPAWQSGGAGLLTTAADYHRFATMLLRGGTLDGTRVLARATVALMTSDHLPPNVAYGPFTRSLGITAPLPEYGQGFGLGVAVRTERGRNPAPGSVGDFCWPGVSGTYWWADPAEDLVAVLMLAAPSLRIRYRSLLRNLVYAALG